MKDIVSLTRAECHWPIDVVDGVQMFCASSIAPGSSYCLKHWRRSRVPTPMFSFQQTEAMARGLNYRDGKFACVLDERTADLCEALR